MVLYLDVIWLLNFLVDSLLLWMAAIFLKRPIKWLRIMAGGLLGSLLVILSVTPLAHLAGEPASKFFVSVLMVLLAFGYKRFRYFSTNLLTLYFATFLTGGFLIGTHYFIQFDFELGSSVLLASAKGFGDPISWLFVMFGLPVAWYFSKTRVEDLQTVNIQYEQLIDVQVKINEIDFTLKGLIDSGNQLQDPLSKWPVMVVSLIPLKEELPVEIQEATSDPDLLMAGKIDLSPEWTERIRFIPAQTIGKSGQLLPAFKPDEIILIKGENRTSIKKALISFTSQTLSADDAFTCIVHPKMALGLSLEHAS
ncbi:MAG TPA: sigma-E processing peptidase SpoIIGA [Chondromyces sp.]|nr:sigma-E processing peptidase SpoIIGA [Chondromyces sp.]